MDNHNNAAWWAQAMVGAGLLTLVAVTCGTVLYLNVEAGLRISTQHAILYGVADAAVVVLGAAIAMTKRRDVRGVLIACIALSTLAQLNAHLTNAHREIAAAAETAGGLTHSKDVLATARADARNVREQAGNDAAHARNDAKARAEAVRSGAQSTISAERAKADQARAEIAKISELGRPADLASEAKNADARYAAQQKAAARAKKACRDYPDCQSALAARDMAAQRLFSANSRADARERAEAADVRALGMETTANAETATVLADGERRAQDVEAKAAIRAADLDKAAAQAEQDVRNAPQDTSSGFAATVSAWTGLSPVYAAIFQAAFNTLVLLYVSMRIQTLSPLAWGLIAQGWLGRPTRKTDPLTQSLLEAAVEDMWAEFTEFGGRMADDVPDTTGATHIAPVADEAPMLEVAAAPVATEQAGGQKADASKKNRERGLRAAATRKANILAQEKAAEAARLELEAKAEEARTALDAVKKVRQEAAQKGAQTKARSKKSRLGSGVRHLAVVGRLTANDNGK